MGLAIGRRVGEDVFIGGHRVVVEDINSSLNFKVRLVGAQIDRLFTITDKRGEEVLPNVFISAGLVRAKYPDGVRMVIEAPRSIPIERGELRRRAQAQ